MNVFHVANVENEFECDAIKAGRMPTLWIAGDESGNFHHLTIHFCLDQNIQDIMITSDSLNLKTVSHNKLYD